MPLLAGIEARAAVAICPRNSGAEVPKRPTRHPAPLYIDNEGRRRTGGRPFPIKITLFAVRLARISDYFALLSLRNDGEPRVYFGIKRFSPDVVGFARYYLSGRSTEKGKQPRVSIVPGRNCAPDKGVALGALVRLASRQEARHISPSVIGRGGGSRREWRRRKKDGRGRENGKPRSRKHFST